MTTIIAETDPCNMEYALKRSLISRNKLAIILKNDSGEPVYCCVQCSAKFDEKEKLELHLCTHNNEYRFLCGICGTGLKRKEHLERHTLEHQEVRPHKCPDCGKAFKRKEHLTIHKTIHKGEKDQICTLCHRSFNRKDHLQKHLQTHSKLFLEQNMYPLDDQGMLEIKVEQEYMEIKGEEDYLEVKEEIMEDDGTALNFDGSYMDYEMEGSDPLDTSECALEPYISVEPTVDIRTPDSHTSERPHVCPICYKSYKRKDHLKIHSWTHMKKDKPCTGCGKAFHTETQLAGHMHTCMQVHLMQKSGQDNEGSTQNEEFNDDQTDDNSLLVEARRRRADSESRPHVCVVCQRRFKRKQHLKVHANVHLKQEATIWCSLCNEGFLSNNHFEQHECRAADGGAAPAHAKKENQFPAELLVQEMVEETSYPIAPDEQNIPVPQRVFVCRYCQKAFKRRDHYKIHLHIHTGVKDFFCSECGKGFYRKDHLQKHSQTHRPKPKPKKQVPDLVPINMIPKMADEVKPEITITAPNSSALRVPLQIKVPYQVVMAGRAVTVRPRKTRPSSAV